MLVSTALVLLMTPALAFFYGGLVRSKNALNTMMMSVVSLGFAGVAWALARLLARVRAGRRPRVGDSRARCLRGVGLEAQGTIPHLLFMAFQGTFAIITAALISGAIVERMRFGAYIAFIALWALVVYAPVAHWVWGGGFLATARRARLRGRHRRAHQRRRRRRWWPRSCSARARTTRRQAILPHNVPFTLLGAGLLWFGWFGFNAGSALGRQRRRRARLRQHDAGAGRDARGLDAARPRARPARVTAVGAATGDRRRPRRHHARGRLRRARSRDPARRHRRVPELLRAALARAHAAGRLARRRRGARPRRHGRRAPDGRARPEGLERRRGRTALRQPAPARRSRRSASWRASPTAARPRSCCSSSSALFVPLRASATRRGPRPRRHAARRGGVRARRRRDPRAATTRRRRPWRCPRLAGRGRVRMKLVVAIVRPETLPDVLEALFRAEVRGLTSTASRDTAARRSTSRPTAERP